MSCQNSTAPINIDKNYKSTCDRLCKFNYDYKDSSCNVENMGTYLKILYDNNSIASVIFNNIEMSVNEIRVYRPSLHTYDGNHADAEVIIKHIGNGSNLLVCVPIQISSSSTTSSKILNTIVSNVLEKAPNSGESTTINIENFNLNNFLSEAPFYSYKATLPYEPCSGSYNYVVFDVKNSLQISSKSFSDLSKIISETKSIIKKTNFYFNKSGSVKGLAKNDLGDGYYLECTAAGDEGTVLYSTDPGSLESTSGSGGISLNTKNKPLDTKTASIIGAVGGGLILSVIIYLIIKAIRRPRGR